MNDFGVVVCNDASDILFFFAAFSMQRNARSNHNHMGERSSKSYRSATSSPSRTFHVGTKNSANNLSSDLDCKNILCGAIAAFRLCFFVCLFVCLRFHDAAVPASILSVKCRQSSQNPYMLPSREFSHALLSDR